MSKFTALAELDPKDYGRTEGDTRKIVLRVLSILGYDIFNPNIVAEEYTCDVGTKRGEKVDFALLSGDEPWCLIEVKRAGTSVHLDRHKAQLYRYFGASKAKVAIMTDGFTWDFYADSNSVNVMDLEPFHSLDIRSPSESDIDVLNLIGGGESGGDLLRDVAHGNAQRRQISAYIESAISNPSEELIKLLGREGCGIARMTANRIEALTPIVKDAFSIMAQKNTVSPIDIIKAVISSRGILVNQIDCSDGHVTVCDQTLARVQAHTIEIPGFISGELSCVSSILLYDESLIARYREITGAGGGIRPYSVVV